MCSVLRILFYEKESDGNWVINHGIVAPAGKFGALCHG